MSRENRRVLVVDDSVVIQRLVQARLRNDGFEVVACSNGQDGVATARTAHPDVILLDVDMPGMNGYETCKELKSDPSTSFIPVIFLTAHTRVDEKVKGLDLGAIDYVSKPFDPVELRARVRSAYRTKFLMDLLEEKAQIDGLTGLYNRAYFDARVLEEFERAKRNHHSLSIVITDVDRFKSVNDTYGHSFGDVVLGEVSESLRKLLDATDMVARYGGEEFVAVLPEKSIQDAGSFANRVRLKIEGLELEHNGVHVKITSSFGVASTAEVGFTSVKELVDCADKALYAAKQGGRNRVYLWNGNGAEHFPG
ncbi:MAG: diguanylate cyclase [Planctomycetota bacterium]